ncbi:MAG: PLD nuclease N-terminal domain-containing protein [Actinomycetota bacterium]
MRLLLTIVFLALTFYAFFDCAKTEQDAFVKFPKWAWLLVIFIFSTFGAILWLAIGRPKRGPGRGSSGRRKIIPPDDDPDFLRKL